MKNILVLAGLVVGTQLGGGLIGFLTQPQTMSWYDQLNKPWFNPPGWVFGPVWTLIYLLMAISAYLVWRKVGWKWSVLKWYFIQLALNYLWSILFFTLQNPFIAFLEIILLQIAILKTFVMFKRVSKPAGYLLVPYMFWVGFATLLNLAIVILN
jgi:tryptophan-rich sensory protein